MNRRSAIVVTMLIFLIATGCRTPEPAHTEISSHVPPTEQETPPVASPVKPIETAEAVHPGNADRRMYLIYDDDGSRDGMAALLYLLSVPDISVEAVNISYGEAHPELYIQHVGRALDSVGIKDIPLGAGQDASLAGGTPFPDWLRQLSDNFWDYPLPNLDNSYPFENAPELMVSIINQNPEPVTLFLSGTFTNLAQALRIDPGIKEKIAAVYFMGGAVYVPGNITNLIPESGNRVAEWNMISDPQAAKEVFAAGLDMYMIPLDATNQVVHSREEILPWRDGDAKANFTADLYDIMLVDYGFDSVEIFDQTAAVLMVHPELCEFEFLALDVIVDEGPTQGQTVIVPGGEPNIHVCVTPNVIGVKQNLDETYSSVSVTEEIVLIDPVVGNWRGAALNNDFELQVSITIDEGCELGEVCGSFDIENASCSGTFTWTGMDGEMYQFQAGDKTSGCGEGIDYLVPQEDGTVRYISRGDYGETEGVLQREP